MKTVLEALKSCVGYPVPKDTIETIAVRRGIYDSLQEEINTQVMGSKAFALCEADIMKYLVTVANVSEGDVSISVNDKDILSTRQIPSMRNTMSLLSVFPCNRP